MKRRVGYDAVHADSLLREGSARGLQVDEGSGEDAANRFRSERARDLRRRLDPVGKVDLAIMRLLPVMFAGICECGRAGNAPDFQSVYQGSIPCIRSSFRKVAPSGGQAVLKTVLLETVRVRLLHLPPISLRDRWLGPSPDCKSGVKAKGFDSFHAAPVISGSRSRTGWQPI